MNDTEFNSGQSLFRKCCRLACQALPFLVSTAALVSMFVIYITDSNSCTYVTNITNITDIQSAFEYAPWNSVDNWLENHQAGYSINQTLCPIRGDLVMYTQNNKNITLNGTETMIVIIDMWYNGLFDSVLTDSNGYVSAVVEFLNRMRSYGVRVMYSPSNTLDSYSNTDAYRNGLCQSVDDNIGINGIPISYTLDENWLWMSGVQVSKPPTQGCAIVRMAYNVQEPLSTRLQYQNILSVLPSSTIAMLNRTCLDNNYWRDKSPAFIQPIHPPIYKSLQNPRVCPSDDWARQGMSSYVCYDVDGCNCPQLTLGVDSDGNCWCNSYYPWSRQNPYIDMTVNHSTDAYIEDYRQANCFAKKHGIKNVILIGGSSLECLIGRPASLYMWVKAGYNTMVAGDLILTDVTTVVDYAYGIYAGIGATVLDISKFMNT